MKSNISQQILDDLIETSIKDGIEKLVAGAVIWKDSGVLLLKRVEDDFLGGLTELPSGTVDAGEDLLEALQREVKEETGLSVSCALEYLGAFDYKSGSGKKTRQFTFLVETEPGEIVIDPAEHDSFLIISPMDPGFLHVNVSDTVRSILNRL